MAQWLLVVQLAFAAVLGLRMLGALEWIELAGYDQMLRMAAGRSQGAERVVLVGASEEDLNRWGWPLSDELLGDALDRLAAMGPRMVLVDLYRDLPRPPGAERLDSALQRLESVIVVHKFAEGGKSGIPAPAVLRGTDRTGFADTMADPGGLVRRGLLFLDDGQTSAVGITLRAALEYLRPDGIAMEPDPQDPALLRLGRTTLRPIEPDDGPYVGADARGYQILLDFKGGPRPFRMLSLSDLLDGKIPDELVANKAILLGVAADSVKDFFYVPIGDRFGSEQAIYGIELHAHLVGQLLRHAIDGEVPLGFLAPDLQRLWTWIWCMAGGFAGSRIRSPVWFAAAAATGLAAVAGAAASVFLVKLWVPVAAPGIGWFLSAVLVTSLLSQQERRQRQLLMGMFSSSVSPAIADALWEQRDSFMEGGRPRPQTVIATVLFTDLKGFTSVSEGLDPARLLEWLNDYMNVMATVVDGHGGVIDKFIGDSIMALFGVPLARDREAERAQDAVNAVECALAMRRTLEELNATWSQAGMPTIGMRVGIFTGSLVAGSLGSARRQNYTVIGDTVNTASRLESFDKSIGAEQICRILVGEPTLALLGNRYDVESVGEVGLKGKAQPVKVFMIRGASPNVSIPEGREEEK